MKLLGIILAASLILTALRAAIIGLVLTLMLFIVAGALFRPKETLGFLTFFLVAGVVHSHPLVSLAVVALAFVVARIKGVAS
jgi:hypothetical protein